jgi:hypothetical protein
LAATRRTNNAATPDQRLHGDEIATGLAPPAEDRSLAEPVAGTACRSRPA